MHALAARAVILLVVVCMGVPPAFAQGPFDAPPGPYAVDIGVGTTALPAEAAFYPPLADGAFVPARGLGPAVGAHVYLFRVGPGRLGVGVAVLSASGHATTPVVEDGSEADGTVPDVARVNGTYRIVAPQVSLNFGTARGWSYVSGGVGAARVTSTVTPGQLEAGSGWVRGLNVGGGARWFLRDRVGVGFDLRLHGLSSSTEAGTPGAVTFAAVAGLTLR